MARKTLLNEQEIRKFLKLANITTVGDDQIQEMGGGYYNRDDDKKPDQDDVNETEETEDTLEEEEMSLDEEEDEMGDLGMDAEEEGPDAEVDMDMDLDMDAEADEMTLSDEEAEAIIALADKLRAAMDEPAGDMGDMGDEPEMEPEGGDELEMAADDDDPMMEEEELEEANEDDIVAEVARRVAERLQATNRKEQVVDALAERIMKRLTK
tara:strand:- start:1113 stop:1742 length:630 start_codon:yes stop_codon:yes gene_type:complete